MARPTIYTEEYITKVKEYIDSCVDDVEKKKVRLPSIEGLAVYLDINKDTIYAWCEVNKEFSDVIDSLRANQANKLLENGLSGAYNPTIAKVLLTKHGYREGTELDLGGKSNPILVTFIDGKQSN